MTAIKRITLVSCCGAKLSTVAPARQLYRSPLFQKSAAWADRQGDDWFVLSAKYGLIKPDQQLASYDLSMRQQSRDERRDWALCIVAQLDALASFWAVERLRITLMAGQDYASWVPLVHDWCQVDQPMEGMQIGERLQWLTLQLGQGELALEETV